ncbi:MAG: transposase, partial [Bacteroidales bacterium]|nr:transposase [Bacteroidales bacterium]
MKLKKAIKTKKAKLHFFKLYIQLIFKNDDNLRLNQKAKNINELYKWYLAAKNSIIREFISVVKLIRKHENEIMNYFICAHTNA